MIMAIMMTADVTITPTNTIMIMTNVDAATMVTIITVMTTMVTIMGKMIPVIAKHARNVATKQLTNLKRSLFGIK